MKKYYAVPTQVKFRVDADTMEDEGRKYFFGIAYGDEVICGCCGGIVEMSEIESIESLEWVEIESAIGGNEYDEEFS